MKIILRQMNSSAVKASKIRDFTKSLNRFFLNRHIHCSSQMRLPDIDRCYKLLNIPPNSEQEDVRQAFLKLAKKYHPDSGSSEANIEKFVEVENAFRTLTKYNTGYSSQKDVDKIIYDIRHKAPQHRQYLSYEGYGIGTPYQRQKQYEQARAQRAAENVLEHRVAKTLVSDNTLMEKGQGYKKQHDIKTNYGFDRLVEDLIQESMSKGEFENLSGKGKPLKNENRNPYVDFTTHKLNEVLINNGFTPEWITLAKEIEHEVEDLKEEIRNERRYLGPYPLAPHDEAKWKRICKSNGDLAKSINFKINKYNLIVPLISKQKFHVQIDEICEDILKNGEHSVVDAPKENVTLIETSVDKNHDDFISLLFRGLNELFHFGRKKKFNRH